MGDYGSKIGILLGARTLPEAELEIRARTKMLKRENSVILNTVSQTTTQAIWEVCNVSLK
jgi:hypothetical protein